METIEELVQEFADKQLVASCWNDEDQFRLDMTSMVDGDNDELISRCIKELEFEGVSIDRENEELMSSIVTILSKDAAKKIRSYKAKDFELDFD